MVEEKFKSIGIDVTIYEMARIVKKSVIEIGDHTRIDDFSFIYGGKGIKIGRYCHISSFVSIIGGGELFIGDYVSVAAGARILTGTDRYDGGSRMSTSAPIEQRNPILSTVRIEKDGFVGTNAIVFPGVTIGEGAVLGANSLAKHDLEPWGVYVGSPCKKIKTRPKVKYT